MFTAAVTLLGYTAVFITQTGRYEDPGAWGGLEHSAMIMHAASYSEANGEKCVFVEAGAHMGTIAILSAKMGCTVHAFEANPAHVATLRENIKLNDVNVAVIPGYIDNTAHRIDRVVSGPITHLKMDIDGMDYVAMKGVNLSAVAHINIEFNPKKLRGGQVAAAQYVRHLMHHGFRLFVYCCVQPEPNLRYGECFTRGNYEHRMANGQGNPYRETIRATRLSECVFGLVSRTSTTCKRLLSTQEVHANGIEEFVASIQDEIDLIGWR
jgi:hypothetical protein